MNKGTARESVSIKSGHDTRDKGLLHSPKSTVVSWRSSEPTKRTFKLPKEQKAGKTIKIDINRYIVKYDFDVASKICPIKSGATYND